MVFHSSKKQSSLVVLLFCLTILFLSTQIALFSIHYQLTELIDTLVNHSVGSELLNWVILGPIITFITIQLIAYALWLTWVCFIAKSTAMLFRFSVALADLWGIFIFALSIVAILTLNNYFFPDSFFSELLRTQVYFKKMGNSVALLTSSLLIIITLLAYVNFFKNKKYVYSGLIILFVGLLFSAVAIYDKLFLLAFIKPQTHMRPNVIIIGLDSLRPDFTSYFGNQHVHTPHIDQLLQSASVFTDAYTPLGRTFPAWVSILTAKYPLHHYARNNLANPTVVLRNDNLARHLQQSGYETIYATDEKRFSNINEAYGFDRILGPRMGVNDFLLGGLSDFPLTNLLINLPMGRILFPYNYANRAANITYEPNRFLHLVELGLAKRDNKPLFLAIHFCISHWPFLWARAGKVNDAIFSEQYRHSVEAADKQLGKFLFFLQRAGLLNNTLLILLSDHGTTLGLPNDRFIDAKNFLGAPKELKLISQYKLSSAPTFSLDFQHDYTLNTSYGQGTDVLSLNQYHVLMAFKGFGINIPTQKITDRHSLIDIAPTILEFLKLKPISQGVDGHSLISVLKNQTVARKMTPSPFFIETGDTLGDIESDKIAVEKVVKKRIGAYELNKHNGLLFLNINAEKSIIKNKQRAVLYGDWLLAKYPKQSHLQLVPVATKLKNQLAPKAYVTAPYFVLVNLKTGKWTMDLTSVWAKRSPLNHMLKELHTFYGNEW